VTERRSVLKRRETQARCELEAKRGGGGAVGQKTNHIPKKKRRGDTQLQ